MRNKIAFVMGVNSRNAGGLFFTISSVSNELCKNNDIFVLGFKDQFSNEDCKAYNPDVKVFFYQLSKVQFLKRIGYSPDLSYRLKQLKPQIIHQQGIWCYYSKTVFDYAKKNSIKVIIQSHGMLDPWAVQNSSLKKKIVSFFYENKNLKNADCLHALNREEYEAIRNYGLSNPVAIIPNGIHLPMESRTGMTIQKSRKILLFIGRIHPKKGLELLIDALDIIKKSTGDLLSEWEIRIAGWDQNNHQEFLQTKIKQFNLENEVKFVGPVFNEQKQAELQNADAFILPSFSEGLPMTILEAWSYKLPVLMTKECNLPDGFQNNAAILLELKAEQIAACIENLIKMSYLQRKEMGIRGYDLVKEKFTWEKVANMTEELYSWVLGKTEKKPDFVYLD